MLIIRSGFFGRGEMQKEFENAAFALQPGQVSEMVDTASGVHLIERYAVLIYSMTSLEADKRIVVSSSLVCA